MRHSVRVVLATAIVAAALAAGAAAAHGAPGLPRSYDVQRVDSPSPTANGRFGVALVNVGDINGDGRADVLTGTDKHGTVLGQNQVAVISGANGAILRSYALPDVDVAAAGERPSGFGNAITRMDDIGSCPAFAGSPGQPCALGAIGAGDGMPEHVVAASGVDVNVATGAIDNTLNNNLGVIYIFDGATGALLKRLVMPAADRTEQTTVPTNGDPRFGRTVLSPGDVIGSATPDLVVAATDYKETKATAHPDSQCATQPGSSNCLNAGRVYVYDGADIAGSNPATTLETPAQSIRNPRSQPDEPSPLSPFSNDEAFGILLIPIGDVGVCNDALSPGSRCTSRSNTLDGKQEFAVAANAVDLFGMTDVGIVLQFDAAKLRIVKETDYPEPTLDSSWGIAQNGVVYPALGDVAGTTRPDFYMPDIQYGGTHQAQGRGFIVSGDPANQGSFREFPTRFSDPTPQGGEQFGLSAAGLGDVAGAETDPALDSRGEIMIGAIGPHNPAPNPNVINDVHIFSPITGNELQRIEAPDAQGGSSFGIALAPLGDVNADTFADFAVAAGFYKLTTTGPPCAATCTNAGRVYIFRSNNAVPPPPPPPPPPPAGPTGPAGPSGAAGPGGAAGPPGTTTTTVRAGRTLELAVSRDSVRRGARVTLRGEIEAFADAASCERGQTVALQRRSRTATSYRTFVSVRTNSAGRFTRRIKPTKTYVYRARVAQSARCLGAASNRETIVVTARRGR